MQRTVGTCQLELVRGDITQQQVEAIVNAANSHLAGGGGVDGAIHRAAGPSLMQETKEKYPDGCPTGGAVVSQAGSLAAKYVFHAVGPRFHGGDRGEAQLLSAAYRRCLELAVEHDCHSIAFPAISTGVYGYPVEQAARESLTTVIQFLQAESAPRLVRFVLFSDEALNTFSQVLREIMEGEQ